MTVCKRVEYAGRVQGVGFRYHTQNLAQGFAVAGYVRNLANGNVELVAEGAAEEVDRFIETVASEHAQYIASASTQEQTPGGFIGFRIRF
jgi:acylphosphatase